MFTWVGGAGSLGPMPAAGESWDGGRGARRQGGLCLCGGGGAGPRICCTGGGGAGVIGGLLMVCLCVCVRAWGRVPGRAGGCGWVGGGARVGGRAGVCV